MRKGGGGTEGNTEKYARERTREEKYKKRE
jgi:hypothetical protein